MNTTASISSISKQNISSDIIGTANKMHPTLEAESYPPPPLYKFDVVADFIPWCILFIVGTLGNTAVLSYVIFITRSLKSSVTALGNTFVYVVVLSIVDLIVVLSIPIAISHYMFGSFELGEITCKIYLAIEISNKICSTLILTALAFDRYMAICHPSNQRIHHHRQTLFISIFLAILSLSLVMPVIISSGLKEYKIAGSEQKFIDENGISHRIRRYVCSDLLGAMRVYAFGAIFLFAFLIPCICLMFFYGRIILRLRKQQRAMLQSRIPIRRITIYTMLVTFFHICCLVPFWIPQIYVMVSTINHSQLASISRYLKFSHLLPYISASINWVFYAQMNSQFKKGLVLVTERMIRKRTKSLQQNGNGRDRDTWDGGMGMDLMSQDDVIAMCPNCEAQLTFRGSNGKKSSLIPPLSPYAI